MEEERKNWLSERTGKSVESKKLIVTMKIEIEEANKRNHGLETKSKALSKYVPVKLLLCKYLQLYVLSKKTGCIIWLYTC